MFVSERRQAIMFYIGVFNKARHFKACKSSTQIHLYFRASTKKILIIIYWVFKLNRKKFLFVYFNLS